MLVCEYEWPSAGHEELYYMTYTSQSVRTMQLANQLDNLYFDSESLK